MAGIILGIMMGAMAIRMTDGPLVMVGIRATAIWVRTVISTKGTMAGVPIG